ncbi:MAG: gamma-glutamylcyclotransferase family protein [Halofilum sp. (in: g-proteobacteria)]|nr:gamma-glutamylcyclotransferase family protein [Halofilum sp. (in: g-proteobacteria)]
MQHRVFAYGTLMFPGIAAVVTGEQPPRQGARLDGHARRALRDRPCPGAFPCRDESIPGVLLHRVSPRALARIDEFEGERYRRQRVNVQADDGVEHTALVYLLRPRWHPLLLPHDWCHDTFHRQWHAHYIRRLSAEFGAAPGHPTTVRAT